MDYDYIFLKSLECGYTHLDDIYTIFEQCVDEHHLDCYYKDFYTINGLLHKLLYQNKVYRIKRGFYNITSKGQSYLNTLKPTKNYDNIITSTVKMIDALATSMIQQLEKQKELDKIHPIKSKYLKQDGYLIDELHKELNCNYVFFTNKHQLKIITFKPLTVIPGTLLSSSDIVVDQIVSFNDL
jgi:hypothetical protein